MNLKVINGTRSDHVSMCDSCKHIAHIKGATESKLIKYCSWMSKFLRFNVTECNQYYPKNLPSLAMLTDAAWILSTSKGRKIGFNPPTRNIDRPGRPIVDPFDTDN